MKLTSTNLPFIRTIAVIAMAIISVGSYASTRDSDDVLPDSIPVVSDSITTVSTAAEAFMKMPSKVLELLNSEKRSDLLAYVEAGRAEDPDSMPSVVNTLGGSSQLIYPVTDEYLAIRISPVSQLTFRILPRKHKKEKNIVAVVYTLGDESTSSDSEVAFYDSQMNPLKTRDFLKLATLDDFLDIPDNDKELKKELVEMVPFPMVEYTLWPDSDTLTAKLTVGDVLGVEDQEKLMPYIRPMLRYRWDGHKFNLIK